MSFRVIISKQAEEDIRGIYEYIAFDLHSVKNAVGQINRLEKEILSLDQMPNRFALYKSEPWRSRNLRVMPVDNYLVFYIPDIDKEIVSVLRVMYGGRDVAAQLGRGDD